MVRLKFLGGIGEVGKSAILVDNGVDRFIMDYGIKIRTNPLEFPKQIKQKIDYAFITHAHLDHSGAVPLLKKRNSHVRIYSTPVTKSLTRLLLEDNLKVAKREQITIPYDENYTKQALKSFKKINYRQEVELKDSIVTLYDAGHIPGSSMITVDTNGKRILYTGDFKLKPTNLMFGCDTDIDDVDILITESTYSDREHPNRKKLELELVDTIKETIENGGIALIAAFAVGRTQEILTILEKYKLLTYPTYLDGMGIKATNIIKENLHLIRKREEFKRAVRKIKKVKNVRERSNIIKKPGIIISGAGMLDGGPMVWYMKRLAKNKKNTLILTGYQVEGSAGRMLLETGHYMVEDFDIKPKMNIVYFDFSAHAGRSELLEFIDIINPQKIFVVHGEHTKEFAEELNQLGYDAIAPDEKHDDFKV
ncbi:MAG: MBL fold metallo-hydrolase [Candidatus Aenigmarchaeota archaeon]|nr:MBL fold metallo-hydrolase [Candidatus Aenigmarchaeota archaeon]